MNVISAIDSSAIYAKVGEQYLYRDNGTLTGEPISALRTNKLNITDFDTYSAGVEDSFVKYNDIQYAIGSANTATGSTTSRYSVALGNKNSAYNSFVIGNYNKGKESHIFGDSNSGINSYIVGYNCTGNESYLLGKDLSGKSWGIELGDFGDTCYPVIVGNKNDTNTSAYFVVGCGNTLGNADAFIVSSNKVASAADFIAGNGVSLSSLTGLTPLSAGTDLKIENDIISVDTNGTAIGDYAFVAGSSTVASGTATFAIGNSTSAKYSNSVAMGISSIANKAVAFAQGDRVSANGYASHAEGGFTYTENNYAHAEGYGSSAFSQIVLGNIAFQSHAEGTYCIASGRSCHAEGENTSAIGTMCHAEGKGTLATAYNHAEGVGTSALGVGSHSEGYYTIASSVAMHAGGKFNKTSADALFVIGNGSAESARSDAFIITSGGNAIVQHDLSAEGRSLIDVYDAVNSNSSTWSDTAYVPLSTIECAIGTDNTATYTAFAQGLENSASNYSFAQGYNNLANMKSFALGSANTADGVSIAQGNVNSANTYAVSIGYLNSSYFYSNAIGYSSYSYLNSFAFGESDQSLYNAYAFGKLNSALNWSLAVGSQNTANNNSFALGTRNSAVEEYCMAQGYYNTASTTSFAQGNHNRAVQGSIAQGINNSASNTAQAFGLYNAITNGGMAIGRYNKTSANVAFVIGNGTAANATARSDAFTITSAGIASGAEFIAGNGVSLSSLTGLSQVQADWDETVTSNPAYIQNKPDVLIPVDSPAALGGISKPTNIMVVSALPASPDSATIYLVQGTMIGN